MKKKYCLYVSLLILFLQAFGEEQSNVSKREFESSVPPESYLRIFKDLPTLYEYVIATLQEKPEVLENNNILVFNDFNYREHNINKRYANIYEETDGNTESVDDLNNNDYGIVFNAADSYRKSLDPEEVAAKCIWVEQELEDYDKD